MILNEWRHAGGLTKFIVILNFIIIPLGMMFYFASGGLR